MISFCFDPLPPNGKEWGEEVSEVWKQQGASTEINETGKKETILKFASIKPAKLLVWFNRRPS
jgi:hypothetical protein